MEIKDSGERRQFETGAVRDMAVGKGRCDLMPLDALADYMFLVNGKDSSIGRTFCHLAAFQKDGEYRHLLSALDIGNPFDIHYATMFLETAKQFEGGAVKYGENNWQKGIPVKCYIDSAVRHYLKWLRGDEDEPHDRAFCWNLLCAVWTCKNKPELNDFYVRKESTMVEFWEEVREDGIQNP